MGMVEMQVGQEDDRNVGWFQPARGKRLDEPEPGNKTAGIKQDRSAFACDQGHVGHSEEIVLQSQVVTLDEQIIGRFHKGTFTCECRQSQPLAL